MTHDLFDHADKYPISAGYAKDSDTSREAAHKVKDRHLIHDVIIELLVHAGKTGLTVDEAKPLVEAKLGRAMDRSTVAARFTELKAARRIYCLTDKRMTPMLRKAHVHVLAID